MTTLDVADVTVDDDDLALKIDFYQNRRIRVENVRLANALLNGTVDRVRLVLGLGRQQLWTIQFEIVKDERRIARLYARGCRRR